MVNIMTTQEKQKIIDLIREFCIAYENEVHKNFSIDDEYKTPQFYKLEKELIKNVENL